jgi:hypothetical protein
MIIRKSEITYTEAVGVLSGLKVLEGSTEDGVSVFKPIKTLSRAEAAAIATRLIGVQDKVVDSTTFTDVEGWAKTYIAIAQSQGLINGRNATTYDPNGTLTGYEWEKIVLCAIGYDAEIEGLVGATWQASTAVLAGKVGLLNGLEADYDATKAITREQAAQIAYNGLKAYTVIYPTTINKVAKVTDTTLGALVFGLNTKFADSFNLYGAPVEKSIKTTKGKVVTEVYSVAYEAVETYNNIAGGTKIADIIDDLADAAGVKAAAVKESLEIYVDGSKNTTLSVATDKVGGLGVDVAAYAYGDGEYRIVVINSYVEVLAKGAYTAETKNSNDKVTAEAYFTLDKGTGKKNVYLAAEGFEIGNIVVYTVGNTSNVGGDNQNVAVTAEAETAENGYATTVGFNGTLATAKAGTGYIIINKADDKTYFDANTVYGTKLAAAGKIVKGTSGDTGYYSYVYDKYGNIIYVEKATRETVSEVGHLYVIGTISYYNENKTTNVDNLYYDDTNPQANAQALVVLYTDDTAEVQIVDRAISQTIDGKFKYLNEYGEAAGSQVETGKNDTVEKFMEYYVTDDGKYVLTNCTDVAASLSTNKDGNKIITKDSDQKYATVNTKITYLTCSYDPYNVTLTKDNIAEVAKAKTFTASTAVGYGSFKTAQGKGYLELGTDGKATVGAMMINTAEVKEDTTKLAMLTGVEEDNTDEGYIYTFVTSAGEELTYSAAVTTSSDAIYQKDGITNVTDAATEVFKAADVNSVYTLYLNSDEEIVGYAKITSVEYLSASYVSWKSSVGYLQGTVTDGTYAEKTIDFASGFGGKVYDTTTDTTKDVASIVGETDNDYVAVYKDSKGAIVFVETLDTVTKTETISVVLFCSSNYDGSFGFNQDDNTVLWADVQDAFYPNITGKNIFNNTKLSGVDVGNIAVDMDGDPITFEGIHTTYAGVKFDVTYVKTTYKNGAATYAAKTAQAKAAAKA